MSSLRFVSIFVSIPLYSPKIDVRETKRRASRACRLKLVYDSLFTHVRTLVHREFHRRRNYLGGFGAQLRSEFQAPRQRLSQRERSFYQSQRSAVLVFSRRRRKIEKNRRANVSSSSPCPYRIAPLPQKLIIFSSSYLKLGRMLSAAGR